MKKNAEIIEDNTKNDEKICKIEKLKKTGVERRVYIGPSFILNGRIINHGSTYIFKDKEEINKFVKSIGVDLIEKALVEPEDISKKIRNSTTIGTKENIISNSIIKKVKEIKENNGGAK